MRIVIIAGGDFYCSEKITSDDYVICADSGYDSAKKEGIHIDLLLGDMDSVSESVPDNLDVKVFPVRKDYTDTEAAVHKAVSMSPDEIVLLGCTGSRVDHSLANILLLRYIQSNGIKAYIEDKYNRIYYYKDNFEMTGLKGKTVSLIPLGCDITGITTEGLDYCLNNETLNFGETRGISNVIVDDRACYCSVSGEGLIIITNGN